MAETSDYKRGSMDIREHESTYALFWSLTKWSGIFIVLVLLGLLIFRT